MTIALGLVLGSGLLLIASPRLWPRTPAPTRPRSVDRMRAWLARAGLDRVPPAVLVVVSAAGGAALAGIVESFVPVVAVAAVAGVVGALLPATVVSARGRARRRLLRAAWPDLVDHLVSAVRSGQSLADAVTGLAEVGPPETRAAFREFGRTVVAMGTIGVALDELKARLADPVADRIAETIRVSREVGGTELPSVLRALAAALREDAAVRAEVEARQSWVVNAARLGVAAPWLVLLLLGSRPEAAAAYNSPAGFTLLGVGFGVTVLAYRLMVVLGRLPDERRWFA
ncbi:MAG: type secretion system protein [Schumannella sp.]|nr:type secretion system protein [Schumannella sp.]